MNGSFKKFFTFFMQLHETCISVFIGLIMQKNVALGTLSVTELLLSLEFFCGDVR